MFIPIKRLGEDDVFCSPYDVFYALAWRAATDAV